MVTFIGGTTETGTGRTSLLVRGGEGDVHRRHNRLWGPAATEEVAAAHAAAGAGRNQLVNLALPLVAGLEDAGAAAREVAPAGPCEGGGGTGRRAPALYRLVPATFGEAMAAAPRRWTGRSLLR